MDLHMPYVADEPGLACGSLWSALVCLCSLLICVRSASTPMEDNWPLVTDSWQKRYVSCIDSNSKLQKKPLLQCRFVGCPPWICRSRRKAETRQDIRERLLRVLLYVLVSVHYVPPTTVSQYRTGRGFEGLASLWLGRNKAEYRSRTTQQMAFCAYISYELGTRATAGTQMVLPLVHP